MRQRHGQHNISLEYTKNMNKISKPHASSTKWSNYTSIRSQIPLIRQLNVDKIVSFFLFLLRRVFFFFSNQVEERLVSLEDLLDADEVFCTGTAVVVAPVSSITYQDQRY